VSTIIVILSTLSHTTSHTALRETLNALPFNNPPFKAQQEIHPRERNGMARIRYQFSLFDLFLPMLIPFLMLFAMLYVAGYVYFRLFRAMWREKPAIIYHEPQRAFPPPIQFEQGGRGRMGGHTSAASPSDDFWPSHE
jgi:hypothetical protein